MKKLHLFVVIVLFCAGIASAKRDCKKRPVNLSESLTKFTEGNDVFSYKFLYELYTLNGKTSVITSPFSMIFLLGQLALFSTGETHKQLMSPMNLKHRAQVRKVLPAVLNELDDPSPVEFDIAGKSYFSKNELLTEKFKDETEALGSIAENINFNDAKGAAKIINKWVAEQTNNMIPTLVSSDMFDAYTRLVLVNAIFLKGNWTLPFKASNTQDRNFYLNNIQRPVQRKTMYQQARFQYGESNELQAKILKLYLKGGQYSLNILLPFTVEGLDETLKKMESASCVSNALNSLKYKTVDVYLPKFEITSSIDLKVMLPKVGVSDIFDKNKAELGGILQSNEDLYVSSGIQKAIIEVNENGLKAAAATAIVITAGSSLRQPEIVEFIADHPFAFQVQKDNYTLFCGTYTG